MATKKRIEALDPIIYSIVLLGIAGFLAIIFISSGWGIGVSPDSTWYIRYARHMMDGEVHVGGQWPPLYPLMLSLIGLVGIDPLNCAIWLNGLLYFGNIFLAGYIILDNVPRYPWLGMLGSFLMLTSVDMMNIHSMAWTEPLFIFLGFGGMFMLSKYLNGLASPKLLVCSLLIAMACITRYAGIAFVIAGAISILLLSRQRYSHRFRDMALFGVASMLPLLLSMAWGQYIHGKLANRVFSLHPPSPWVIMRSSLSTLSAWILPESIDLKIRAILMIALIGPIAYVLVRHLVRRSIHPVQTSSSHIRLVWVLSIFIIVYWGFLLFSITFLDKSIPLSSRILSPIFMASLIFVLILGGDLMGAANLPKWIQVVCISASIILSVSYTWRGATFAMIGHKEGLGFTSKEYKTLELIKIVKKLPEEKRIFSNEADMLYILTGRTTLNLPDHTNRMSLLPNADLAESLKKVRNQLQNRAGVLIYVNKRKPATHQFSESELIEKLGLNLRISADGGSIYEIP